MTFKRLSLFFISDFTFLMFASLTAGNSERCTEEMMFDPVLMSTPSTTHLVILGHIPIVARARVKTI